MDFVKSQLGKMQLWPVEHFWLTFFPDHEPKVFKVRGDFLQNPYFRKGTWHWALFSNVFNPKHFFVRNFTLSKLLSDFCSLCQKWKLTRRHCVRFRLKKKKSIVKDNRDVFFWAQKCTKIFRWWGKRTATPVIYDASPSLKILIRSLYDVLVGSNEKKQ